MRASELKARTAQLETATSKMDALGESLKAQRTKTDKSVSHRRRLQHVLPSWTLRAPAFPQICALSHPLLTCLYYHACSVTRARPRQGPVAKVGDGPQ